MEEDKLTKTELLELEAYIDTLHENYGLSQTTLTEVKYKITLLYKDAED